MADRGGDAQGGELQIMYDGGRIINDRSSYDPMRKQGAILLGNGGDNNNYSQGTFSEGAMTAANTFPSQATNQRIQDNVVAAGYDVPLLTLARAEAVDAPPLVQTFSPGSSERATLTFTNTTGAAATDIRLSLTVPSGWSSVVSGSGEAAATFGSVAPGESVSTTFEVTSGRAAFNGDLVGQASWTAMGRARSETTAHKVRNVPPVKINEFRISAGFNTSDSFIELYNAGEAAVDISGWTLTPRATQLPIFSAVTIPSGTTLPAGGFYLLGLSTSGLAVPARAGDTTLYLRSVEGLSAGDEVRIGTGSGMETRTIASVGTAAGLLQGRWGPGVGSANPVGGPTTLWQPLPDGPVITIPAGSNNVPVENVSGFEVGQKMALGYGATYPNVAGEVERYEVVTVTEVGKPGTQGWLSMRAHAGDTNIKVSSTENISVGDEIRLDIDSEGYCIETVTVTRVGTPSERTTFMGPLTEGEDPGTGLDLADPLQCDHASNMPFSARGTGISFEPATRFPHSSNEPVLPLGTGITLDQPLANDYAIDAVVHVAGVSAAGYQGTQQPDQWFGGPALSPSAGSMVLRDAAGRVVESLNYGSIVDPWASEGYHGVSGAGERGCFVPSPVPEQPRRFGAAAAPTAAPDRSAARFPDGRDWDSNCNDFQVHAAASLAAASAAGADNIKVGSVEGLAAGQTVLIGTGADRETAVIESVGSPGATAVALAAAAGATEIEVNDLTGFEEGHTITIGSGADEESAVVASTDFNWSFGNPPTRLIIVTRPLTNAHGAGEQVAGSGITLTTALTRPHPSGAAVVNGAPTPGEPNRIQGSSR